MKLINTTLSCEETIRLSKCYLLESRWLFITDYLLVYTDGGGFWSCLAVDDEDIDRCRYTIDLPCPDGKPYHFEFQGTDSHEDDETELKLIELIDTMYPTALATCKSAQEIQTFIMDCIIRYGAEVKL